MANNSNGTEHAMEGSIDKEDALARYDGDEKIYEEVLKSFTKNNSASLDIFKSAIGEEDIKLAHRTAHSLRGAAGLIGASRLAGAALDIENTLALMLDDESYTEIQIASDDKLAVLTVLLENEFEAVFNELGRPVESMNIYSDHPGCADRLKTIALIDKIAPFLSVGNTKCLEYMDEIEDTFRPAAEVFQLFMTQMEQYDFEQAYETLNDIRRFLIP